MLEMENKFKNEGLRGEMIYGLSFLFVLKRVSETCLSTLKWGHGTRSHQQQRLSQVKEDSFLQLGFSFGYS